MRVSIPLRRVSTRVRRVRRVWQQHVSASLTHPQLNPNDGEEEEEEAAEHYYMLHRRQCVEKERDHDANPGELRHDLKRR